MTILKLFRSVEEAQGFIHEEQKKYKSALFYLEELTTEEKQMKQYSNYNYKVISTYKNIEGIKY